MNFKKTALRTTFAAMLAIGVCSQANAFVYAGSGLAVDALLIGITGPGVTTSVSRFDFNLTNTATLNGVSAIQTATCGGTPGSNNCSPGSPVLDAQPAVAPGSTLGRANNASTGGEFTFFGPLTGFAGNYSTSDSVINNAELVTAQPTSTRNIAEANISTATSAASSSQIQSITGLTFTFTIGGGPASLSLAFNADPDLQAFINNELGGTFSAQANLNASFTLNQNTGGSIFVNWNPQGTAANDCIAIGAVCTETADSQDLNINVGTTVNGVFARSSWDPNALNETAFWINITGHTAGTYTLTLNDVISVQLARTPLPEPGTLALMGIGLMGLFASTRRKKLG